MKSDKDYSKVKINVPSEHNELIQKVLKNINSNEEIKTLWMVINVNAIDRLKMTDHGHVHFQIVANISLKIARMLDKHGVELSIVEDYGLSKNHSELVILLTSLFHDLGMTVNREGHEEFSIVIANKVLHDVLDFLPINERTIVISEVLHCIISHRKGGTPYTLEAGIVRVADALDMSEGRSRIPYKEGTVDIHSISAAAIDKIDIKEGEEKPIQVIITMNNSAGLFQVDELLKRKLKGSGLEEYISVKAIIENEQEKSLLKEFNI
jgi:metal-dependent HD superfamily phosphatase/phosphodiesterase